MLNNNKKTSHKQFTKVLKVFLVLLTIASSSFLLEGNQVFANEETPITVAEDPVTDDTNYNEKDINNEVQTNESDANQTEIDSLMVTSLNNESDKINIMPLSTAHNVTTDFDGEWTIKGSIVWGNSTVIRVDGVKAHCIEPSKVYHLGTNYEVPFSAVGISDAMAVELAMINYFGSMIPGRDNNFWYFITSSYIWKKLGSPQYNHSDKYGITSQAACQPYFDQIDADIAAFNRMPSFLNGNYEVAVGETITVTDTNGAFSNCEIFSTDGLIVQKQGNNLLITGTADAKDVSKINLYKPIPAGMNGTSFVVKNGDSQGIAVLRRNDPSVGGLNVKVNKAKISFEKTGEGFTSITKKDTDFGLAKLPTWSTVNIPGSEITIYAAEDIKKSDGSIAHAKNSEVFKMTSSTSKVWSQYMYLGKYYYKETKAPEGYLIDNKIHYFDLTTTQLEVNIILDNKRPKTFLTFSKLFEESPYDNEFFEDAYKDVVFGIYARDDINNFDKSNKLIKEDELIDIFFVDQEGYAISGYDEETEEPIEYQIDLPNGNYYIKELQTSDDFILDENEYDFTVDYIDDKTSEIEITINEAEPLENDLKEFGLLDMEYERGENDELITAVEDAPTIKEAIRTGDISINTNSMIVGLLASLLATIIILVKTKKTKRVLKVFSFSFFALSMILSNTMVPTYAAEKNITKSETYESFDENEGFNFDKEITKNGKKYILQNTSYKTNTADPIIGTNEIPNLYTKDPNLNFPSTIKKQIGEKEYVLKIDSVDYQNMTISGRSTKITKKVDLGYTLNQPDFSDTINIDYFDDKTNQTLPATLNRTDINLVEDYSWKKDFKFPITFKLYNSNYYVLEETLVPYNDIKPQLVGKEDLLLKRLSLSADQYQINDIAWNGPVYEKEDILYRDALALGQSKTAKYEAVYSNTLTLPNAQGYRAVATYKGEAEYVYNITATATYELKEEVKGQTKTKTVDTPNTSSEGLSFNTILLGTFFLACLFIIVLAILKKRGNTENEEN